MKYSLIVVMLLLSGCASSDVNILLNTGKKPPTFFTITDKKTMDDFVFDTQKFSFKFPSSKPSDFKNMGGWEGESMRDGKTIALGFTNSIVYHIVVSTPSKVYNYTERERAIEYKDTQHMKNRMRLDKGDTLSISNYGKESYSCVVVDTYNQKYKKSEKIFDCYKFNSTRTKAKSVTISLTYNKPKTQTLAKQYTYTDLKIRAKRMLDSLFIKDGW